MNKRVVILHPAYWEQAFGGAEQQILYLVKSLKASGFDVHYIYEDKKTPTTNGLNINLHPLKKINIRKKFGNRWFLYKGAINACLKKIKPDIIYTRLYSSWSGFAALYANQHSVTHVLAIASDSDLSHTVGKLSILKPFDWVEKLYANIAFSKASHIITQNDYQQLQLSTDFKREGLLIPQSTELCEENTISKSKNEVLILWVANLKPLKRPELFIRIAENFKNNGAIKFYMIGRYAADYKNLLETAQKELACFEYLGELPNVEVNNLLCKAHFLVNTSDYEGFSNTFVQAWMRKVVVVSLHSNPSEILTTQKIGIVNPDITGLVRDLHTLIKNKQLSEGMAEKAFIYARKNHSIENNLQKIITLMEPSR